MALDSLSSMELAKNVSNIALIGMPGCGKTTVGKRIAAHTGLTFLDTDHLIEQTCGSSLQNIVDRKGVGFLREIEESILSDLDVSNTVISTGGSAVFSRRAMQNLKSIADIVYLSISVPTMVRRVSNANSRGLVKLPGTSLYTLYFQRLPLYQEWADLTIANDLPLSAFQFDRILGAMSSSRALA